MAITGTDLRSRGAVRAWEATTPGSVPRSGRLRVWGCCVHGRPGVGVLAGPVAESPLRSGHRPQSL